MIASRKIPKVLVCHPGRQHSHELAAALAAEGMLARYVTGVPTECSVNGLFGRLLRHIAKIYPLPVDPRLVKHVYVASLLRRGAAAVLSRGTLTAVAHRADGLFDRWVCRLVPKLCPDVVVAYENSALQTFRQAKALGVTTVLDAASVHHRWQDCFLPPVEGEREHERIVKRKDEEIRLADHILTVSRFARESYLANGVAEGRVHAIPVGADVGRFRPDDEITLTAAMDREIRFVYVGNASRHKGVEVFRQATSRLRASGARCRVTLIGALHDKSTDGLFYLGRMDQQRLAAELRRHDVLVLPSFFDSFGMVVAEAMASGLPAIVTENVGAKEMITPGENGLIVPAGDAVALADAMAWFIKHRNRIAAMARAARRSAERYDWREYRRRIVSFFAGVFCIEPVERAEGSS
jgi:glycosyltransferase involved in cell wall biosynthesis